MVTPTYTLACTKSERIARDVYEVRFTRPAGFTFKPGQFLLLSIPLIDDPADMQTRSFSVASTPEEEELLFVMKMKEGGRASRWIMEVAEPGTTVRAQGPLGFFTLKPDDTRPLLFVATSTGVGPFRSQIRTLLKASDSRNIDLIFGVRGEEDLFWAQELETLAREHERFSLHIALSSPTDAWKGHRGRVQTLVPQIIADITERSIYICGSPEMTKDMKQHCLALWAVPKEQLHVEGYI